MSAALRRVGAWSAVLAVILSTAPHARAAETTDAAATTTTVVILKVDASEPVPIRTQFRERPPTLTIEFPNQRVVASIPARSTIAQGVIRTIAARYDRRSDASSKRFVESVQIGLSAPYPHYVRSEPGRIIVAIEHPVSVGRTAVEVGLRGGTIIGGLGRSPVSDRFRAMQAAMAQATPTTWTMRADSPPPAAPAPASSAATAQLAGASAPPADAGAQPAAAVMPASPKAPNPRSRSQAVPMGLLGLGLALAGAAAWRRIARTRPLRPRGGLGRLPSGVVLIDQLVWRAFERQGYQLVLEMELMKPPWGILRVMAKDGTKSALLFVGQGPFFEKQTVERVIRAMRDAKVGQGILVAAGSFTVPAQRLAKDYRITLIGREQLIELLSAGAGSEYFTKQLEQSHARLEEAKVTLRQYAEELDTLRRQRNEASWYLGEERAQSAKLEAQLSELSQQLRTQETELHRWEQASAALRRQWEESQWYLGESRTHVRHLEQQMAGLQELAKRVEAAENAQAEASWCLTEERSRNDSLAAQVTELQQRVEASADQVRTLQESVTRLQRELALFRTLGDRRGHTRVQVPGAAVEVLNGRSQAPGVARLLDLSSGGVGLATDGEPPASPRLRVTIPGQEPVESRARRRWAMGQDAAGYHSGYRLVGVPAAVRARLDQLIEEFRSAKS